MQVREKVEKSGNAVFFHCFVARFVFGDTDSHNPAGVHLFACSAASSCVWSDVSRVYAGPGGGEVAIPSDIPLKGRPGSNTWNYR